MLRMNWEQKSPLPNPGQFRDIVLHGTPEWPTGQKGLAIGRAWSVLAKDYTEGLIILDGDVAADPYQIALFGDYITSDPAAVWTAVVKLWAKSTHRATFMYGHGRDGYSRERDVKDPNTFTFCLTYMPGNLVELCLKAGLLNKVYPGVDMFCAEVAQQNEIKVKIAEQVEPVHLHW